MVMQQAPVWIYKELERVYNESKGESHGDETNMELYRGLEKLYRELCIDYIMTSQDSAGEFSPQRRQENERNLSGYLLELDSSAQATSVVSRTVSPYTSRPSTPNALRPSRPTTPRVSPSSLADINRNSPRVMTYRTPSAIGPVVRPRPKSSSKINPYRIDRAKLSSSQTPSPRRSRMTSPRIKMQFETLWCVSWLSVAHRLDLQPLPINGFPDSSQCPIIENNYELILLIYLLRSLSREFESQVRSRLRLLNRKSFSISTASSGATVASARSKSSSNILSFNQSNIGYIHADNAKSNEEISLQASLRLMYECHQFQDSFFAAIEPSMPSWREETDILVKNQLSSSRQEINDQDDDKMATIGSTCTLAFHLVRSIEFIVEGEKPAPIQEDQAARGWPVYNKGKIILSA